MHTRVSCRERRKSLSLSLEKNTYIIHLILDSSVKLNLFPSPFKSDKSFSSQKFVLYSKRLLEKYQSLSNDLFDKISKEPEITRLENNKVYMSKPKVASDSFLCKFKDANLRNMISKCWSRVKMLTENIEQRGTIKMFYCDFGFESIVSREEICIRAFPVIGRIIPRFSYECTLNNDDLVKNLSTNCLQESIFMFLKNTTNKKME